MTNDTIDISKHQSNKEQPFAQRPWWFLAFIVLISAGFGFVGGSLTDLATDSPMQIEQQRQVIDGEGQLIAEIANQVGPSVVSVELEQQVGFGVQQGLGSGIIVSEDGLIVTNKHVVSDATSITVVTADGVEYKNVELVDEDPFNDIAYLQLDGAEGLEAATLGDSSEVVVGERVIAIGNALGEYPNTVTYGIISGLSRPVVAGNRGGTSFESLENLFQTDAAINPGNSGGPLVNMDGEVIGINTAVAGNAENIGFSIPINDVVPGIESVIENDELIRPYLGVRYIGLTSALAERYDLDVEQGAYVLDDGVTEAVLDGSPADDAGIEPGDVIVRVGGEEITKQRALSTIMTQQQVGDEIDVVIYRDGERQTLSVTLQAFED
jgi:serine protease Do